MFKTEMEIMAQHEALAKTYDYIVGQKGEEVKAFFQQHASRKFVFMGCGSSYMMSKVGEMLFITKPESSAMALAGGDYLVNPGNYKALMQDSILVVVSRSGLTSEILFAVKDIKEKFGCPVVSVTMKEKNTLAELSDLALILPWAYDESVCQTRSVTNIYTSLLLLNALCYGDEVRLSSVKAAIDQNKEYKESTRPLLEEIAKLDWDKVVVLADYALCGIAEEGALAFTEISLLPGSYFNQLDYRHGPIVLNNQKTLTLVVVQPNEQKLQGDMISDLVSHGGTVVTISAFEQNPFASQYNICVKGVEDFAAWGIPFIYLPQMIALSKALNNGVNPDLPTGLDAFITLK